MKAFKHPDNLSVIQGNKNYAEWCVNSCLNDFNILMSLVNDSDIVQPFISCITNNLTHNTVVIRFRDGSRLLVNQYNELIASK